MSAPGCLALGRPAEVPIRQEAAQHLISRGADAIDEGALEAWSPEIDENAIFLVARAGVNTGVDAMRGDAKLTQSTTDTVDAIQLRAISRMRMPIHGAIGRVNL